MSYDKSDDAWMDQLRQINNGSIHDDVLDTGKQQKAVQNQMLQKQLDIQKGSADMRFKRKNQLQLQIRTRHYLQDLEEKMNNEEINDLMKTKNEGYERNPDKLDRYLEGLQDKGNKQPQKYEQLDQYVNAVANDSKYVLDMIQAKEQFRTKTWCIDLTSI